MTSKPEAKAKELDGEEGFEPGPVFTRLRTIAFSCIMVVSFAWTILLFVEMYMRWNISDGLQRGIVLVLSIINAGTVVLLIVLLILPFRVWLDTARLLLLIVVHGGTAIGFTVWNPRFTCPNTTPDGEGACRLLNMYILLGSWVVPALLIIYAACLATAYAVYRKRLNQGATGSFLDEEKATVSRGSVLPFMHPPPSSAASTTQFLGPIHPSLPPPGPIYPPLPGPFYPLGQPSSPVYLSRPPSGPSGRAPTGPGYRSGPPLPVGPDRRISTNPIASTSDISKRASRPSKHSSMAPSVYAPSQAISAVTDERRRKDSLTSVSEYSQNSRSSGRVTLTKPIPFSKFETGF